MFWLLMRTRLLSARNVVLETWRLRPVAAAFLCLSGICLFGGMFLGFLLVFKLAGRFGVLEETIYQAFYYFFMLLLAGAVPFVASTLLQSADYSLLFAAPIPPRTVIAAKLLDATITNSLQFTVLGIPAIAACAFALDLPAWEWPLIVVLIALFVLLPALLTAFALLLALAALGMTRLRAAITLINVLMGIGVCVTFVLEVHNLPFKYGGTGAQLGQFQPALQATSRAAHVLPSAWFAGVLVHLAQSHSVMPGSVPSHTDAFGQAGALFGRIVLVCGGLFAACMGLGGRLLSMSSVVADGGGQGSIAASGRDDARFWRRWFRAPVAGMIVKDFKYIWRDTMLLSQLSVPLILFLVPYLIGLQNRSLEGRAELFPFSGVIITLILFLQTSILSLSLLGMEAEGFWMALLAPARRRGLLWAKWLISTLVSGGLGVLMCLIAAFSFHADPVWALAEMGLIVFCAAGLCGLGVGISATFPRFVHENPALRVSPWALIVSFFATSAYMVLTLIVFVTAWMIGSAQGAIGPPVGTILFAFGVHFLLTVVVIGTAMGIGIQRIERYEWEN
jgi:ABC-2 type transport system permease protein